MTETGNQPETANVNRETETIWNLDDATDALEAVDWSTVPGISATEAASFTTRLLTARDELEGST